MIQYRLVQILLAPFSLLYGLGVTLRNLAYATGLLKSVSFNFPVISVGNLSMGGSGKTPHIEFLIRQLKEYIYVATLSRGYKRKTTGFLMVKSGMTAHDAGDEPLQFKRKFPEVTVAVAESRAFGIPQILSYRPNTQVILLDDAFQHRAVKPGLNIMLTDYQRPFFRDFLLPSGRLREWRSAYRRADILIVSKCPESMTTEERDALTARIQPKPHQRLYFTTYEYGIPYYLFNPAYQGVIDNDTDVFALTGIANPEYMHQYLASRCATLTTIEYEDHHDFDQVELTVLKKRFEDFSSGRKMIVTTEKDAMRLELHRMHIMELGLPIFVLPVQVRFLFDAEQQFLQEIRDFLLNFKV